MPRTHSDETVWDERDADVLYEVLEREVVPQFYARDAAGIPTAWIARMRESMATLTSQFSSSGRFTITPSATICPPRRNGSDAAARLAKAKARVDVRCCSGASGSMPPGVSCASKP